MLEGEDRRRRRHVLAPAHLVGQPGEPREQRLHAALPEAAERDHPLARAASSGSAAITITRVHSQSAEVERERAREEHRPEVKPAPASTHLREAAQSRSSARSPMTSSAATTGTQRQQDPVERPQAELDRAGELHALAAVEQARSRSARRARSRAARRAGCTAARSARTAGRGSRRARPCCAAARRPGVCACRLTWVISPTASSAASSVTTPAAPPQARKKLAMRSARSRESASLPIVAPAATSCSCRSSAARSGLAAGSRVTSISRGSGSSRSEATLSRNGSISSFELLGRHGPRRGHAAGLLQDVERRRRSRACSGRGPRPRAGSPSPAGRAGGRGAAHRRRPPRPRARARRGRPGAATVHGRKRPTAVWSSGRSRRLRFIGRAPLSRPRPSPPAAAAAR